MVKSYYFIIKSCSVISAIIPAIISNTKWLCKRTYNEYKTIIYSHCLYCCHFDVMCLTSEAVSLSVGSYKVSTHHRRAMRMSCAHVYGTDQHSSCVYCIWAPITHHTVSNSRRIRSRAEDDTGIFCGKCAPKPRLTTGSKPRRILALIASVFRPANGA